MEKLEQSLDGLQINPEEASKLAEHNVSSKDEESNNQGPAKIHEVNIKYATSLSLAFLTTLFKHINAEWICQEL